METKKHSSSETKEKLKYKGIGVESVSRRGKNRMHWVILSEEGR